MKLAIKKPFTCVGTITSETLNVRVVREAFDATIRLQPYRPEEILGLSRREPLKREGVSVDATTTELIARLAIGNPKKGPVTSADWLRWERRISPRLNPKSLLSVVTSSVRLRD